MMGRSGLCGGFIPDAAPARLFQATKRKARGYRSSEYLITMLYLVAGKLRLPHF